MQKEMAASANSGHRPHSIISWGLSAIIELLMFMPVPNSGHMTPAPIRLDIASALTICLGC